MMIATACLLLLPIAQTTATSPLVPGTRVRVTVRETTGAERTVVGSLRTFDDTTLMLMRPGSADRVALSRSTITRLDISRGQRRSIGRGLLLGVVVGLGALALVDATCEPECESPPNEAVIVGGAVAAGGLVGALVKSERWESIGWAVGPARRSGAAPGGGRRQAALSFGLSLRF